MSADEIKDARQSGSCARFWNSNVGFFKCGPRRNASADVLRFHIFIYFEYT